MRKSLIVIKNIIRNKGKITKMGNSGMDGVGVGAVVVEGVGVVPCEL